MDRWEWPCGLQGTEGNLFLSLDGWNPRRSCEIVKLALRNSSALLEPRDVTRKIWWRSLSPCFYYESAPIIQLSRAHENANIHLGNPLQPTSQIDLIEMHSGFTMHGICTSKTACYVVWWITDYCIRSFTQLSLLEEVHFLIIQIFFTIVFAVLSLDLPCNCIHSLVWPFGCARICNIWKNNVTLVCGEFVSCAADPEIVCHLFSEEVVPSRWSQKEQLWQWTSIVLDYFLLKRKMFHSSSRLKKKDHVEARQRHRPRTSRRKPPGSGWFTGWTASMGSAAQRKLKRMIRFIEKWPKSIKILWWWGGGGVRGVRCVWWVLYEYYMSMMRGWWGDDEDDEGMMRMMRG